MRTRKERLGEILGNVCWFRSIVNSVNSWSGVTLVLAATLYSVMESQLQPTGFHKKIEHHLDKDYFMFWQHFGQFCPPSARKHLPIYLYGRACSTLSVGIPDNCHKGTSQVPRPTFRWKWISFFFKARRGPCLQGNRQGFCKKLGGICRIDPFWDIFYKTSHGQLLAKTHLIENQIELLWIKDWLIVCLAVVDKIKRFA